MNSEVAMLHDRSFEDLQHDRVHWPLQRDKLLLEIEDLRGQLVRMDKVMAATGAATAKLEGCRDKWRKEKTELRAQLMNAGLLSGGGGGGGGGGGPASDS